MDYPKLDVDRLSPEALGVSVDLKSAPLKAKSNWNPIRKK